MIVVRAVIKKARVPFAIVPATRVSGSAFVGEDSDRIKKGILQLLTNPVGYN